MALKTPQAAFSPAVSIPPADTNAKVLRTAAATAGELIGRLRATSTDTGVVTLQFSKTVSGTDYIIGESQIPIGAGTNGTAPWKDVLADINSGTPLTLAVGDVLKVKAKTAVTAACKVDVTAEGVTL